jgi:LysR family transcriptional regulator for bpeEF and oprC
MMDLNDLRVFERVAALRSFSAAARALELPKSSVSRSVARLETELGTRLLQRKRPVSPVVQAALR